MCDLNEKYQGKSFTGFKAALLDTKTNEIRSIATFLLYKPGKVPALTLEDAMLAKRSLLEIFSLLRLCNPIYMARGYAYSESLSGRTAAFVKKDRDVAIDLALRMSRLIFNDRYKAVVIKITLSDTYRLVAGTYYDGKVVAGDTIKKISIAQTI